MKYAPYMQETDPEVLLNSALEETWRALCDNFDVIAEMPDLGDLFIGADPADPTQAAEIVFVNMLMEIPEHVDRFSPWYTRPARAYGLISIRDGKANCFKWVLAAEAHRRWQSYLELLHLAIKKNSGLIQASLLIEQLDMRELSEGPQITARCHCSPTKIIRLNKDILEKTSIICDVCNHSFFPEID